MGKQWPLVGRDDELATLTRLIDGGGGGALVAGPAGVGKSRLAAECVTRAAEAGRTTARATATRSAAQLPFGAFAALLPTEAGAGTIGSTDQASFVRHCCDVFARRGDGGRLVLLIDDAHLLDDASATLVHRLVETGSAFVLATVRTGEPAPDAVAALWKDELVERLDLAGLDVDTIETLLTTALGGPVEPATLARLAARCQGNVLFLRELILGAIASGALAEEGGCWRLVGPPMPSDRLTELIEARLGHLSQDERTVLEAVALAEPLGPAELAAVDTTLLEALERKELLTSRLDGQRLVVRMAHPLYGEVLRRTMPASRARTLTSALADAVEAHGMEGPNDILRVATWRLASGEAIRPELMLPAGAEARALHDFPLAERLLRAGIGAGAGFEANVLLAEVLMLQARYDDAVELLEALAEEAETHDDRARVTLMRIDSLAFCGRAEEALAALLEAGTAFPEPTWVDELAVRQAMFAVVGGFTDMAVEILEPLLPRLTGDALVTGCILGTIAYGFQGRLTEALAINALGLETHRSLGRSHMIFDPAMTMMLGIRARIYAGHLAVAEAMAESSYAEAHAAGQLEPQAWFAGVCAQICLAQGHIGRALRWAHECESMLRPLDRKIYYRVGARQLVEALAFAGEPDRADEALDRCDAGSVPLMRWEEGDFFRDRAWIAVARGDTAEALRLLAEGAACAAGAGDRVIEAAALHDQARLGRAKEVVDRLEELALVVEGPLAPARAAHARALAQHDPGALEAAADAFEELGAQLLAAEAAADAALAWRRDGDRRRAAAAERRSATLVARCDGAMLTPALRSVESRLHLTPSEREVSVLAAAGRSNKEIAETLHLSRGTVQNYLHRVYEKLGVNGREELAAALDS